MPDVRGLVPREPPEGLREWVLETCREELDRHGLVYEAEYAEDYGLAQMLDEWAKPRKVKMVRAHCSCCGDSYLLDWIRDETRGYGFVHPDDQEGDWGYVPTADGDESNCPICGARVLVRKAAAVRGYYVAAECYAMSASVVGPERFLALTGWTIQRRVYKSGTESLKIIPAEAYVFGPTDCAQLMGWRNGYSGAAGYFVQYMSGWSQPARWRERWGASGEIFGLTPELIASSCLPHCKLDVYMGGGPGTKRFPIPYLRLYQTHPNVEAVLLHGLPRLLRGLIAQEAEQPQWQHQNAKGLMDIPEIDWEERRPAQMLRLTKEELRMARKQDWDVWAWDLFTNAKKYGEVLTAEDIRTAFCLGDDHAAELAGRGPVAKSLRYLLGPCEVIELEAEDENPDPFIPDVPTLLDYWDMARTLGRNLNDPQVRFPKNLLDAHDQASELVEQRKVDVLAAQFRFRRRLLKKYSFGLDGLLIRPAASQRELTEEGDALHHCVGTYGKRHAEGKTAIFFIRRASRSWESYYTLELDEKRLEVRQNRGKLNCARTPEVRAFEDKWLAWIRAGAPRGRDGKPVCGQDGRSRKGRAA